MTVEVCNLQCIQYLCAQYILLYLCILAILPKYFINNSEHSAVAVVVAGTLILNWY